MDLNYMFRVPLWPFVARDSRRIGSCQATGVALLDTHELATGKPAALPSRRASRGLFDAHQLLTAGKLDRTKSHPKLTSAFGGL